MSDTYDLEIFQTAPSTPGARSKLDRRVSSESAPGGRRVTGVQKAAQRYLRAFFTLKGTLPTDPEFGTRFRARLSGGAVSSRSALRYYFSFDNADALEKLAESDYESDTPDDERVVSASMVDYSVDFSTGRLYIKVELKTAAGDVVEFVSPSL